MAPREHGAYGQLAVPLVTALAMGRPGVAAWLLAGAWLSAFCAHEPLLVLLGKRGARARREERARARRVFSMLVVSSVLCACAGMLLASPAARLAALVPATLGALVVGLVAADRERSTGGEITVAASLSAGGLPVALAAGVVPAAAWGAWGAWVAAFASATCAVRAIVADARRPLGPFRRLAPVVGLSAGLLALVATHLVAPWAAAAAAPMMGLSLWLVAAAPPPSMLRRVGWMLVGTSLVAGAVLVGAPW